MKFYLSPEATSSIIHNIKLVGNTINGGYIALTEEGNKLLSQIESGCDINLEDLNDDMQELISALIELGIAIPTTARKNTFSSVVTATYLHITNNCNYNCKCCYSYDKKRNTEKDLTTEEIKHIISELSENGLEILAISGGEPFLREDLADILCYAKNDLHIKKIDIATNGSLVTSDVLASIKPYVDNIIVAIDGYSEKKPQFIRDAGAYKEALNAVKIIQDAAISVSLLPTIHKKNYKNISDYNKLAVEIGVPIAFSIMTGDPLLKDNEDYILNGTEFSELIYSDSKPGIPPILDVPTSPEGLCWKKQCGAGKSLISVDAIGDVYCCHMLHYPEFRLGNVLKEPLKDIMQSRLAIEFRQITVDGIEECMHCQYKYLCGGGCLTRRFLMAKDIHSKDPYCQGLKHVFYEFEKYLDELTSAGVQAE